MPNRDLNPGNVAPLSTCSSFVNSDASVWIIMGHQFRSVLEGADCFIYLVLNHTLAFWTKLLQDLTTCVVTRSRVVTRESSECTVWLWDKKTPQVKRMNKIEVWAGAFTSVRLEQSVELKGMHEKDSGDIRDKQLFYFLPLPISPIVDLMN